MHGRHHRWLFLVVLVAGVAAITALWSSESDPDRRVPDPDFGGAYIEGIAGTPSRVNPLFAAENAVDQTLASLVFAGLTRLDERGSPFPDLAETWTVSADGLVYTITLRPGLTWHDGAPVTAEDVVFTYGLATDPGVPIPPPLATVISDAEVTAVDAATVEISLPEPYSPLPSFLTLGILPRHLLDGLSIPEIRDSFFNQEPVGAGPYQMQRLTPTRADLVANPAYHFDQPFIQNMELRFYRDDGALFTALESGAVTSALFAHGLGESDRLTVERRRDLHLVPLDTGEVTYVYLNLDLPIFQDRRVRQALLYALDRDRLVLDALEGQGAVANSPIPPESWAYSPSLTRYDADPNLAGLLLDEAGWSLNEDGVRQKDGQALGFTLTTNTDPVRLAAAQAIADAWNRLGIQVRISPVGVTALVREHIEPRDYEAVIWARVPAIDPDPFPQWHSSQRTGKGANLTGFSDERADAILQEARLVSTAQRRELYGEFQELFAQEVPAIPLYVSTATYVQQAALQGARIGLLAEPGDRFWQVQEWFLKTR